MERGGTAILNDEEVCEIRSQYLTGNFSFADLALAFGVSRAAIADVLTGRYWRELLREGEAQALAAMRINRRKVR